MPSPPLLPLSPHALQAMRPCSVRLSGSVRLKGNSITPVAPAPAAPTAAAPTAAAPPAAAPLLAPAAPAVVRAQPKPSAAARAARVPEAPAPSRAASPQSSANLPGQVRTGASGSAAGVSAPHAGFYGLYPHCPQVHTLGLEHLCQQPLAPADPSCTLTPCTTLPPHAVAPGGLLCRLSGPHLPPRRQCGTRRGAPGGGGSQPAGRRDGDLSSQACTQEPGPCPCGG